MTKTKEQGTTSQGGYPAHWLEEFAKVESQKLTGFITPVASKVDGTFAGGILVVKKQTHNGSYWGWIDYLHVEEKEKGNGLGTALVANAIDKAGFNKMSHLEVIIPLLSYPLMHVFLNNNGFIGYKLLESYFGSENHGLCIQKNLSMGWHGLSKHEYAEAVGLHPSTFSKVSVSDYQAFQHKIADGHVLVGVFEPKVTGLENSINLFMKIPKDLILKGGE